MISLVKPLKVELEKRNLLNVTARVALVMDISGSMDRSYRDGTVQAHQSVRAKNQNVFESTIIDRIQNAEPIFFTLIFSDSYAHE